MFIQNVSFELMSFEDLSQGKNVWGILIKEMLLEMSRPVVHLNLNWNKVIYILAMYYFEEQLKMVGNADKNGPHFFSKSSIKQDVAFTCRRKHPVIIVPLMTHP